MSEFVHLHVHSKYSMLDSALRLESMVGAAKKLGSGALADVRLKAASGLTRREVRKLAEIRRGL